MTVNYRGITNEYNYRIAEIGFSENESLKMDRIAFAMSIKGWDIEIVSEGYALCEVSDKDEFNNFMEDWKSTKKVITNCMKYGF